MLKIVSENIKELANLILSYDYKKDSIVIKLTEALKAVESGSWVRAKAFVDGLQKTVENRAIQYADIPAFKDIKTLYKNIQHYIDKQDRKAIDPINALIEAHKISKNQIEKLQGIGTR